MILQYYRRNQDFLQLSEIYIIIYYYAIDNYWNRLFPQFPQYCSIYPSAILKYFRIQGSCGHELYHV